MEDPQASSRDDAMDRERAQTEAELDAIAERVRSTQRHNLLVKCGACLLPLGGCGSGVWFQSTFDNMHNAWLLGGGVGLAAAVAVLKKFERRIPELE